MKGSKKSRLRQILRNLIILCILGISYFAFMLFTDIQEYNKGNDAYRQVRVNQKIIEPSLDQSSLLTEFIRERAEEKQAEQISKIDFTPLKNTNPDVVAWIASAGTEINYPVVQGDNNEFYLHHLFNGNRNKMGSIFMDYRAQGDFSDRNTLVYGHNMKDGSMFSALLKYKNQPHYDSFPTMLLYTPGGDFTIELFAGTVVDGSYESIKFNFEDNQDFKSYIDSLKEKSTFKSDTNVTSEDRIVTLVTCTYEFDNARYALFGKLAPIMRVMEK